MKSSHAPQQLREKIELRQQANYWQAQHARAVEREAELKERISRHEEDLRRREADWKERVRRLEEDFRRVERIGGEQAEIIEALEAKVAYLQHVAFGRKSEKTKGERSEKKAEADGKGEADSKEVNNGTKRPRGQQPGTKGHGRKRRESLPTEEIFHDLPPERQCCPNCRKPFSGMPGTEDSEEIEWEVRVSRKVHKRKRYKPTCDCQVNRGIVTAPVPPKLIPKGMFTIGFIINLLMEKWLFQRPINRVVQVLGLEGFAVSPGTLTGTMERVGELIQPLYAAILEKNRNSNHWHMDETRWMVFAELEGKSSHRWWLWVVVTKETCVFILDPTRSAKVPREHFGQDAEGIINADRYVVYKTLGDKIRVAFCWSHVRRDFKKVEKGYPDLSEWAESWVVDINKLFKLNKERLAVRSKPSEFQKRDAKLRTLVNDMEDRRKAELADASEHEAQRKVLNSLKNHWDGLTIFVDNPDIPMDNNEAERSLRNGVVGRKNYYGNRSIWSGMLTAMLFTLFQTVLKNNLDPKKYLTNYFEACAANGGKPPDEIDRFLPWNMSDEQLAALHYPRKPT